MLRIGNFLILTTVGLVATIALAALFRHDPLVETIQFALILTVASIPVALPAVLSVTMAVGAEKLARMKAIVSRLVAIEEMAGMDILCSDKTGTLTKNELTLGDPSPADGVTRDDLLVAAALASRRDAPDAIDGAILAGLADASALDAYQVKAFRPFDPVSKRAEADVEKDGQTFSVAKGAPQVIVDLCKLDEAGRRRSPRQVDADAGKGLRTLGVARTDDSGAWRFLGLLALFDPPRDDSAATIAATEAMGVDVKMVTGDHEAIARQIAGTAQARHQHRRCRHGLRRSHARRSAAGDRGGGRLRPRLPRAQVQDRQGAAGRRPHRRHDRRRGQRRAGAEAGRCRHRGQRRHRRGARGGRSGADRARPVGDHARHRGSAPHLRADDRLRDLPHRRDHPHPAVHDGEHPGLQLLSGDRRSWSCCWRS